MTQNSDSEHDEPSHGLLERYLAGECSAAEQMRVERWLRAEPANRAYLESLRTAGEAWAQARPRFDSQAAWRRMAERTAPAVPPPARPAEPPPRAPWGAPLQASFRRAAVHRWLAAAVASAAVVGAVLVAPRLWRGGVPAPVAREYATAAGQQRALTLPDGTKIRLAPESRLVVDGEYGTTTRTVRLAGEAYFEVKHDVARPFRVLAGRTVAWDLGTKFTVRAYAGELLRLAVAEGSVAIPQALAVPLRPRDVATVDRAGHGTVEHGADVGRYLQWLDGTLEFRETPLSEAAADLSRWYGVEVVVADPALARRRITVAIKESTVEAALDLIAPAVGARYERQGRTVIVSALEKTP